MADRPILFSTPMVRALLDGRKTQTRRILKEQPELFPIDDAGTPCSVGLLHVQGDPLPRITLGDGRCGVVTMQQVRFAVGDRLWVKETWRAHRAYDQYRPGLIGTESRIWYEADGRDNCDQHGKGRPSIFMPRWASRLTLIVTDVRVERLHMISEEDAQDEGVDRLVMDDSGAFYAGFPEGTYRCGFAGIWTHINGAESWDANPWVVAVSFTVERRNIDL